MMLAHIKVVLGLSLLIPLVFGCASQDTRIDGEQYIPVENTQRAKVVALVLASYSACATADQKCMERQPAIHKLQNKFESCISSGMRRIRPDATLIKHREIASGSILQQVITELAQGKAVNVAERLRDSEVKPDYVVSIGVSKSESPRNNTVEVGEASPGRIEGFLILPPMVMWGVGQEWQKSAYIQSRIYDVKTAALAAQLSASLTKDASWFMPVLTVVPLPPVGYSPNVEATSCKELGEAIGRFLSGAGNDFIE